jgi:hypothetical protein
MGGLFGIGGSSTKTDRTTQLGSWGDLSSLTGTTSSIGGSGTATGQANTQAGTNYFSSLLSNQPGVISQAVAPQVSALTGQAQQQRQQTSEFGNRSGGTTASQQATTSQTSGQISNLINSLIPGAASNLENVGVQQQGLGLTAFGEAGATAGELGTLTEQAREQDIQQQNQIGAGIASLIV